MISVYPHYMNWLQTDQGQNEIYFFIVSDSAFQILYCVHVVVPIQKLINGWQCLRKANPAKTLCVGEKLPLLPKMTSLSLVSWNNQ